MIQTEKAVLVTGGSGFAGSQLCWALVSRGERVRAVVPILMVGNSSCLD
jgi:nucleoside-diphosphate-sugar epimerase